MSDEAARCTVLLKRSPKIEARTGMDLDCTLASVAARPIEKKQGCMLASLLELACSIKVTTSASSPTMHAPRR